MFVFFFIMMFPLCLDLTSHDRCGPVVGVEGAATSSVLRYDLPSVTPDQGEVGSVLQEREMTQL